MRQLQTLSLTVISSITSLILARWWWHRKRRGGPQAGREIKAVWHDGAAFDQILASIVVIRVNYARPLDGEQAGSAQATGFVVDSARGIILTNRHVMGCGPIRASATFSNKEEVPLTPLYRDPVHDFGFFHFEASALRYARHAIPSVELAPTQARVGLDIRVVGNDNGEKASILSGTLARLDRNAPHYHSEGYNDANTFYYSAASNTSGGSSGSPVLDAQGRAVALNAGGSNHSSQSYYLPLHSVVRALDALRCDTLKPRGDCGVVWRYLTCDETRRMGVRACTESELRAYHARHRSSDVAAGLLVVDHVVPSSTEPLLQVGDALLRLESMPFPDFDELEARLDVSVGQYVCMEIERCGSRLQYRVHVDNLHATVPSEFIEFGGSVIHALSYHTVRNGNLDRESGVYVASAGFVLDAGGVPSHSVLTAVGELSTPTLDAFEMAVSPLRDSDRVIIRYYNVGDRYNEQVATLRINNRWCPPKRWVRSDPSLAQLSACGDLDKHGLACWHCRPLNEPPVPSPRKPMDTDVIEATFQRTHASAAANGVVSSLCKVSFDVLYAIDGVVDWHFVGAGLVVDAERGFVAVDRNTVVTSLGEATVTFAASVEVPAQIVFVHPTHNFAIVRYDPARFAGSADPPTTARLDARELCVGDDLIFVGLCRTNADMSLSQRVGVTEISCVNIAQAQVPRFRVLNEEIAKFDQLPNKSLGGVLVDDKTGAVVALWSCYSFYSWNDEKNYEAFHAVSVDALSDIVKRRIDDPDAFHHSIGFGLKRLPLSTARTSLNLDKEWVKRLQGSHPRRSQVLAVSQLPHSPEQNGIVHEGDLLLAVDNVPTPTFGDVEAATRDRPLVELTVWRDSAARRLEFSTQRVSHGPGTNRVIVWCGLLLQCPHRAVLEMGAPSTDVYCSYYLYGSPSAGRVKACCFVVQVNGQAIHTLDDFVLAVKAIADGSSVTLHTSDLQGQRAAANLKTDYTFWPSHQYSFDSDFDWHLSAF